MGEAASVILLSAAGMYALMSFTVAQRTREIAIRAALGAEQRRLIRTIFGRATWQLVMGLLVGSVLSGAIFRVADLSLGPVSTYVPAVAGIMVVVGLLAAVGPARRALRIQPSEALRADA